MKNVLVTTLTAVFLFLAACGDSGRKNEDTAAGDTTLTDPAELRETIDKQNAAFESAIQKGDSAAIAGYYASDALVMPPNSEAVRGNGILNFWGGSLRQGVKDLQLETTDLVTGGDLISETGNYEMFGAGKKSLDKGKYLVVWKKEDGVWKIYRDMFSSNLKGD